jgi:uncharacterized membrane protein (UPF0127 family)
MAASLSPRLQRLPTAIVFEWEVCVAKGPRARLLGLAHLDREEAGAGLFIPRCSSVHTFGMRFPLDLYFLDGSQALVAVRENVPGRRVVVCRGALGVLERPAASLSARPLA